MKMDARYAAIVGAVICTALLVSYAIADPGHGHAYGHSQSGTSGGGISNGITSGGQLTTGDGTAALTFKNGDEFFTPVGKVRAQGSDFVPARAGQAVSQKNDQGSQFLNTSGANSSTTGSAGSATTAPSKPNSVTDAATQKPDWVVNASSSRPKPKASPIPSATPGLTPKQPSIDPPPLI